MNCPLPIRTQCAIAVSLALTAFHPVIAAESEQVPAEVIVTAQSRVQQIQNVPIAIQTLSGTSLKEMGYSNLSDLDGGFVPGLTIRAEQATRPQFFLRGIGTLDFGIGTDSPVGIYIDGVYTGKTGGSLLNFNDVKRIEVLKGPQGTLYGRNAAAGAIAIVTNDPVRKREASGLLRVGNNGLHHEELVYNTPLSDNLAFRFSAVNQRSNGWVRNTVNGQRFGGDGDWGTRAALRWQGDETTAVLSWEHEELDTTGPVSQSLTQGQINFGSPTTWTNPLKTAFNHDAAPDLQARNFDGLALRVEHPLSFATLSSTTAYRRFSSQHRQDNDGSANPLSYLATGNVEKNSTWQQEFKLNGQYRALDWVAGISAFKEKASQVTDASLTSSSIDTIVKNSAGLAPYATMTQLAQGIGKATGNASLSAVNLLGLPWQEAMFNHGRSRAYAAYGDLIWHLNTTTNLTIGGRYTHDKKSFDWFNPARSATLLDKQLGLLQAGNVFQTAVALKLLTAQQAALLQGVPSNNLQFNNPVSKQGAFKASHSWDNFSPRVVLDKHLTPDSMLFASWSKGYQAGGFDAVGVNGRYEEETVTNVEVGAKGQIRNAGFSYSISAFKYDFTNLQSLTLVPASLPSGIPAYKIASSDQKATGLDVEANWKINRYWRVYGAAEYLDQEYGVFTSPTGINLSGQPVGTPYVSATLGATANWMIMNGGASLTLAYAFTGNRRCNADTTRQGTCLNSGNVDVSGQRERIDLRAAWDAPSTKWGVALVINNLADKRYLAGVSTLGAVVGSPYAYLARPRSAALELRVKL